MRTVSASHRQGARELSAQGHAIMVESGCR